MYHLAWNTTDHVPYRFSSQSSNMLQNYNTSGSIPAGLPLIVYCIFEILQYSCETGCGAFINDSSRVELYFHSTIRCFVKIVWRMYQVRCKINTERRLVATLRLVEDCMSEQCTLVQYLQGLNHFWWSGTGHLSTYPCISVWFIRLPWIISELSIAKVLLLTSRLKNSLVHLFGNS